ncbi:MAG: diphthine--ammonia ligase [Arenicellales bacterium]
MLWTGGKDSAMALYEATRDGCRVTCLVTFAPPEPDFRAHPLAVMKLQAEAMALPHRVLPITPPFDKSYETALCRLRDELDIDTVITGDIAEVDGHPNWIRERSRPSGIAVLTPLWGRDRDLLLRQLLDREFKARISCVNTRWLGEDWIGRELNDRAIAELRAIRERTGLDLCGEEGEYHTVVTDGPLFVRGIDVRSYSRRTEGPSIYMEFREVRFTDAVV